MGVRHCQKRATMVGVPEALIAQTPQMPERLIPIISRARLTPSEIGSTATELLSFSISDSARVLFLVLNSAPAEVVANVLELFHELALREPGWQLVLEKSIRGSKGRCPKKLRRRVRDLLSQEASHFATKATSFADVLTAEVFTDFETVIERRTFSDVQGGVVQYEVSRSLLGRRTATVRITTDLTDIRRMESLAVLLARLDKECDELILDFKDVDHVYVVGLAALMAWCTAREIRPQIRNASELTERYLDAVGFSGVAPAPILAQPDNFFTLAIEPILDKNPEDVSTKLVDIIDHHIPLPKRARSGLIIAFAELIENVHRHAGAVASAFACAQVYPRRNKLTICIVDTGMGIRQSILCGTNPSLVSRLQRGELAAKLATSPLVTSKPDRHSGYGLYVVSELVVRNGGTFRLFSDNEILTLYRKRWTRQEYHSVTHQGWNGTWIAMLIDLDSLLPMGEVYSTLPPMEGTEMEDFFQ